MCPFYLKLNHYSFGRIKIDGKDYTSDLWIINGEIVRRHKSISRRKLGTSHKVSVDEIKRVVTGKTKRVIVGIGASGLLSIEEDAVKYLEENGIVGSVLKHSCYL